MNNQSKMKSNQSNGSTQQQPIFGERCIEDVFAFIDEQLWKRKQDVDTELWNRKVQADTNQFSISIGDHIDVDLLDINTDAFEELMGDTNQLQNNENANIPQIVQPDITQQSLQIHNIQKTGESVTNNQPSEQEFSTINMELFKEMMADPNPIELSAINQIMQPNIEDSASENINKAAPIGVKKQPEECLGAMDPDFAPPLHSKENPYIVYKATNKKSPIVGAQRILKRLQRTNDNRSLDNIKKFNMDVENRGQAAVLKMILESIAKHQNAQGVMLPETRKAIKSGLTKSLIEQQNTYHDELDEIEIQEQMLVGYQDSYYALWSFMAARKESVLARRRQQQQQQQINNVEPAMITQPQPENPPPPPGQNKEKVLTIKLNGIIQVKRSYEHISNENVTGENVFSITNEKNIKRKASNNQKCLNNVYSKETQLPVETDFLLSSTQSEFDSESEINNINDIGLQQLDQLQTFETETRLNQILFVAEIHANPDYEPILNTSNEIHNENTLTTGNDISVAIEPSAAINDLNGVNTTNH
ncbi:unnamed protein product [Rotaria magnacalcarata]|uniref:Uncharacterized protein n=1 Tax=Rotaria magnacalcarata TaxID=392030 RepID=A0A816XND7_9BILA|nr:unnamed protein product [Rotaria magnacalcarata]